MPNGTPDEKTAWEKHEQLRIIDAELLIADRRRRAEIVEEENQRNAEIHEWNRDRRNYLVACREREEERDTETHKRNLRAVVACEEQSKNLARLAVAFETVAEEVTKLRKLASGD